MDNDICPDPDLPSTRICLSGADDLATGSEVRLEGDSLRHLKARRLQRGARLLLFDGRGREWLARLTAIERRAATALVLEPLRRNLESPLAVTLLQGICKGDRMDYAVQKAVELGAVRIVPVITAHGVVRLDRERAPRRRSHWQQVAISACEQCGRSVVPEVSEPRALADALTLPVRARALALDPGGPALSAIACNPGDEVYLLVGPEGGLAPEELQAAANAGWATASLGPRILRAETAAVAALTALQVLAGDLRQH